jgi:hypothetical protein
MRNSAQAQTEVDLALVLAVDASSSMDEDEQNLQRQGYADAFRSPLVQRAIRSGALGRIAVIYMDWAEDFDQRIVVPWSLIGDEEQALIFAGRLEKQPIRRDLGATSISGAIDFARRLLSSVPFEAARKVIDISGDGRNNHGQPVAEARERALLQGITINGLPLVFRRLDGLWDSTDIGRYYHDCVIGGAGAFSVPVANAANFAEAIRIKLMREIALPAAQPRIRLAQDEPPTDCREGASNRSMR